VSEVYIHILYFKHKKYCWYTLTLTEFDLVLRQRKSFENTAGNPTAILVTPHAGRKTPIKSPKPIR
jgi:hypothetical protein